MEHAIKLLAAVAMIVSAATGCIDPSTNSGGQFVKLLSSDGADRDFFGGSVAISGSTAVVGASNGGSAYLFDTTTGQQIAKLTADDDAVRDDFGFSVAISGTTAIVGALGDQSSGVSGLVYLFDTRTGQQIGKLRANDGTATHFFGYSMAISGTTAIVGDPGVDDDSIHSGSAYLFDVSDPANPRQITQLIPNDGALGDGFGTSVAISSTTAIVGAAGDEDNGRNSGSAYLFDLSDSANPTQVAKLLLDDGAEDDLFGFSVAISGTIAIVGAHQSQTNGISSGSAYLFDTTTGQQVFKLLPDNGAEFDSFGRSVAISGTTAIVGAKNDDDNGEYSGSVYLFDTITGQQIAKLLPNDGAAGDGFGTSVAISGTTTTAIVGAPQGENANGRFGGAVYILDTTRR